MSQARVTARMAGVSGPQRDRVNAMVVAQEKSSHHVVDELRRPHTKQGGVRVGRDIQKRKGVGSRSQGTQGRRFQKWKSVGQLDVATVAAQRHPESAGTVDESVPNLPADINSQQSGI